MKIKLTYTQILDTIDTFGQQFNRDIQEQIIQLRKRQEDIDNIINNDIEFPWDSYNDLITEWDTITSLLYTIVTTHCTINQLQTVTGRETLRIVLRSIDTQNIISRWKIFKQ